MSTTARVWIVLAAVYALFFGWYTSFGGPLTKEEIAHYTALLEQQGGAPERIAVWRHFMETDTGDDFAMLNALDLAEAPRPIDGVAAGESSSDVMSRYSGPFMGNAMRSAAHPVIIGWAAAPAIDVWGIEGADDWTQGALVRYRSRRDLMRQVEWLSSRGDRIHEFKSAALEKTIAYPLDPWFQLGDPRLVLALGLAVIGLAVQLRITARRAAT